MGNQTLKLSGIFFIVGLCILKNNFSWAQENIPASTDTRPVENTSEAAEKPGISAGESVLQIKCLDAEKPLYSFELRNVEIGDLFRVMAHDYKLNLLVDKDVGGSVTASLSSVSLEEALETIAESQNLILRKKNAIIRVSLNLVTKIFTLKHLEAKNVLESSDSAGTVTSSGNSSTIYNLLSDKGRAFLGKQPNSIMVIDYPPHLEKIGAYLKEIDQKMTSRSFKLKYLKAAEVTGSVSITNSTSAAAASSAGY